MIQSINERIKELEFQDCKVRVTNVDSQASDQNIVIQVIGEISNKSAPHKKFTQTFVLAGQTNGYFVLNDIFRYIVEEDEVTTEETQPEPVTEAAPAEVEEPATTAAEETTEPETLTSSSDPAAVEEDAAKVDKVLEEKVINEKPAAEDVPEPSVNGVAADESALAEAAPAPSAEDTPSAALEAAVEEAVAVEAEKPKDPEPTPVLSPAKPSPAQPASPAPAKQAAPAAPAAAPAALSKPSAPKTWANLAAAAHRVVTPAVPAPQQSTPAAPAQSKAAPAPSQAAPAVASPITGAASARDSSPAASQSDEWQSVGDHKRQQSKAQAGAGAQETAQHRAYIKNVSETIDTKELRAALEKFGELIYFDIARQKVSCDAHQVNNTNQMLTASKNCAFVDFKTAEGYKAAMEANPHQIGNERVIIEERRVKPGSYPYVQRGGMRGGRGAPSNNGNGRGSLQGGGRGGFPQRGRGGNAGRGRGGAPAA